MAMPVSRYLVSLEEFERMVQAEVFAPDARLELIEGEILAMSPINYPHESCVARLTNLLLARAAGRAYVWPQNNSIRIPGYSRPQPDLTLLKWHDALYSQTPPEIEDVLLLVEVSDSSLRFDRGKKRTLYAVAGIAEYWIVNLRDKIVEVYSNPSNDAYMSVKRAKRGEKLPLPGGLSGSISVDDILGEDFH